MFVEFKRNNMALKALSNVARQSNYIDEDKMKIIELPECRVNEREMVAAFANRIGDFPSNLGTISIYVVNEYGTTFSQLVGCRKSAERSVAEDIASMLTRYEKRYSEPISAFLIRFVPEINGRLSLDDSVARIFNAH